VPPLATPLFGADAHEHAGAFAQGVLPETEVADAMAQHRRSGRDVGGGPAELALMGEALAGLGTPLVAALSGAMAPSAATLTLRQALPAIDRAALAAALGLGQKVRGWLAGQGRERQALRDAVGRLLGQETLAAAARGAESLRGLHGRSLGDDAQRRLGAWRKVTPTEALLELHARVVVEVRDQVVAATARYLETLTFLTSREEDRVAVAAAGYLAAGLGARAFGAAPDVIKVAVAEAQRVMPRAELIQRLENVEFRKKKFKAACEEVGIAYETWREGTDEDLRFLWMAAPKS